MERYLLLSSDIIHTQLCPWWIRSRLGLKEESSCSPHLSRREGETEKGGEREVSENTVVKWREDIEAKMEKVSGMRK